MRTYENVYDNYEKVYDAIIKPSKIGIVIKTNDSYITVLWDDGERTFYRKNGSRFKLAKKTLSKTPYEIKFVNFNKINSTIEENVWDTVFFPGMKGKIEKSEIFESLTVTFSETEDDNNKKIVTYNKEGKMFSKFLSTLSSTPYAVKFINFTPFEIE